MRRQGVARRAFAVAVAPPRSLPARARTQAGFSLAKLAGAVATVAVGLALFATQFGIVCGPGPARAAAARADLRAIASALESYAGDNGHYPSTAQGLAALVRPPAGTPAAPGWRGYLKDYPRDPWGNPYRYVWQEFVGRYAVTSYGADGKPGGEDEAADISSRPPAAVG